MLTRINRWLAGIKVWGPSNVYKTAVLSPGVSVGRFAEVGDGVVIGKNTRIGKGSFIPAGVTIGGHVFIGPHVCFTNDMYPPSDKSEWEKTVVEDYARIGAGVTILPGVVIGHGALIGAGAVVTENVPRGETWAGVPARKTKNGGVV